MNPLRRPVLSGAVLLALIVLFSLGTWQVKRLAWKEDLIATVDARLKSAPVSLAEVLALPENERAYQPVRLTAEGQGARTAHVNGIWDGKPGYYVFTLVRLPDGGELPVNHGFVAFEDRAEHYDLSLPAEVIGLYRPSTPLSGLAKSTTPPPDLGTGTFYARDPEGLLAWLFGDVPPPEGAFYVDRTDNKVPGTVPLGGTARVEFRNSHLGYALTWYGLAIGLIFIYVLMMRSTTPKK